MKTNLEDLVTQAEAARIRGVSREAIYNLVSRGRLAVVEIGGQKFVKRGEVENFEPELAGRPAAALVAGKATKKRGPRKK